MSDISELSLDLEKPQWQPKETSIALICPKKKCFLIPRCSIIFENKEPKVNIKCACDLEQTFSLSSFLSELKKVNYNNNMQPRECWRVKHMNNPVSLNSLYYCIGCEDWVCEKCAEEEKQTVKEKSYHIHVPWKIKMNNKCENQSNHGHMIATNYCIDCNKNLCKNCLSVHQEQGHNLFNFKKLSVKKFNDILKNYAKGKEKLDNNNKIYIDFINTVSCEISKLQDEISKLQGIKLKIDNKYQQNEKMNNSIIELIDIIISNYVRLKDIKNYNLQYNLLSIDKFNLDTFPSLITNKTNTTIDIEESYNSLSFAMDDNYLLKGNSFHIKENSFHIKDIKCENVHEVKNHICALTILQNGYIVSGSDEGEVFVLNSEFKPIKTFHTSCVTSIYEFKTNIVAVCGYSITLCYIDQERQNDTLSLAPLSSGKIQKIINIDESKFASCSEEKLIRIWESLPPYSKSSLLKVLEGHKSFVKSMIHLRDGRIVSIGRKYLIFWKYNDYSRNYEKQKSIEDIECSTIDNLMELEFSNQILVGGNGAVTFVDILSFQKQTKITPLTVPGNISSMMAFGNETDGNVLFLIDGTIIQFKNDSEMEIIKRVDESNKNYYMAKGNDNNSFITCSADGLIKKWVIIN